MPVSITREKTQGDALSVTVRPTGIAGQVVSDAFLISDISDPRHMSGFGATQTLLEMHGSGIGDPFSFLVLDAHAEAEMTFAVDFRLESPFDFVSLATPLVRRSLAQGQHCSTWAVSGRPLPELDTSIPVITRCSSRTQRFSSSAPQLLVKEVSASLSI